MPALESGDQLPKVRVPPPGPISKSYAPRLAANEAPAVNTLFGDRPPIVWAEALGSNVLDVDGNRYIDLTAGFGAAGIGHRHPQVVAAIIRQTGTLLHGLADVHAHPQRIELSDLLRQLAPVDDPQVYYAISGADAVEVALQSMVLASGRPRVIAFDPAYHGLTLGALSVSSRQHFREPFSDWLPNTVERLPWGCSEEVLGEAIQESPEIGGIIVEPVVGREGVIFPPVGWLSMLARVCQHSGLLLTVDEIFTGLGRTGRLWACDEEGVRPDLICCGKILGGGVPIAAVLGRSAVMQAWDRQGEALHTATFLANPLACAAALATLEVLTAERLVERSADLGRVVLDRLEVLKPTHGVVEVRGRGLLWGIELDSASRAGAVVQRCLECGILILTAGEEGRTLEICPALSISLEQLETALDILCQILMTGEDH